MPNGYNPDFAPTGVEGGVDTNALPWLRIPQAPGLRFKPLRASGETGMISAVVALDAGTALAPLVHLGAADLLVLSGRMHYTHGPLTATVGPGTWGYIPANSRVEGLLVDSDTELLVNLHGPVAFLDADGRSVTGVLTSLDIQAAARHAGLTLVPNTLAECLRPRPFPAGSAPLAIADDEAARQLLAAEEIAADGADTDPHFVDTRALEFSRVPANPGFGRKILRVSEETGHVSMIFRHNGVAGPHYHLGAADFMVLSGRIGYRAGPPEGYGRGVWFYEPAGARHDSTRRLGDEDLIYTANIYGPIQFDDGPGTPVSAVMSWMQYKAAAAAAGHPLVANVFEGDSSLLAWSPLGSDAAASTGEPA
ncbi:MAG: hypothetical protein F4121_13495 [Acidimicrobiia bacterium]|nr:hypothetical protein [Acidimicrobiia bacterium]MYC46042.1 hypothetical protein [Acidimicrobiia bacterium]MYI21041.1 hypothetical protein [Acidimicrobiia bacterium]